MALNPEARAHFRRTERESQLEMQEALKRMEKEKRNPFHSFDLPIEVVDENEDFQKHP